MKKFLFVALGCLFALAMYAAEPADVGKAPQSTQIMLMQADVQQMVVDFMFSDFSVNVIATTSATSYVIYQAMPAEVSQPKFKLEMPVFRLRTSNCVSKSIGIQSNRLARNSLPPNFAYGAQFYA